MGHEGLGGTPVRAGLLAKARLPAVRTAAVPGRADLEFRCDAQRRSQWPGSSGLVDGHLMRDTGQATTARLADGAVGPAVQRQVRPGKQAWGRRRFAPAKPGARTAALRDVATKA